MLIDPTDVTRFDRNKLELQTFILFCCVVAGKKAQTQARLLANFLKQLPNQDDYFDNFSKIDLLGALENSRLGQYKRLAKCFALLPTLDLRTCSVLDLENIPGIGPKTARMFLVHSRPDQHYATLDTHILKFLRGQGIRDVPKATPSPRQYFRLEKEFLKIVPSDKTIAEFDLMIWNQYSQKSR